MLGAVVVAMVVVLVVVNVFIDGLFVGIANLFGGSSTAEKRVSQADQIADRIRTHDDADVLD